MLIGEALAGVETVAGTQLNVEVSGVQYDSRRVGPGDIFVAMRGEATDGNRYVGGALDRGATAIVTDSDETWDRLRFERKDIAVYRVAHGRRALAGIAANLFGHPERKLKISAVTGTNGKTTTAFLLEQMLRSVGRRCVLVGTIETHVGDEIRTSEHTTPEASDLLRIFADGVAAGCTEAVMEMSSHALEQERVWGIPVDVAMFTNLTQDHLDYHGTMEQYGASKAKLFAGVGAPAPRVAVINMDDENWLRMEQAFGGELLMKYGLLFSGRGYKAMIQPIGPRGTRFFLATEQGVIDVESPLIGRVNGYNLLTASCAALARGLWVDQIATAIQGLRQVPGRFERVPGAHALGFTVVVDYAHTDDALRNLIAVARKLAGNGRVITVFGCGGDRDKTKRPKMGRAAGEGSDLVVLTSDNPRTEDPAAILVQAYAGVQETATTCIVEEDRAGAIEIAIRAAGSGDIVLIAGKGHEKVQIFAEETVEFDDVAVAAGVIAELSV